MPSSRRRIDLGNIKGRIAEALVESIFRRAEFKMTRFGRETDLRAMLKTGGDEDLTPDFLAMKEAVTSHETPGMYQTYMIEVKYRADLSKYLLQQSREGKTSLFAKAKDKWPNLCIVLVTEHPEENRSCFQAVDLASFQPGELVNTVDLHKIERFDIYEQNVRQHEELAMKIFGLLSEMVSKSSRRVEGDKTRS